MARDLHRGGDPPGPVGLGGADVDPTVLELAAHVARDVPGLLRDEGGAVEAALDLGLELFEGAHVRGLSVRGLVTPFGTRSPAYNSIIIFILYKGNLYIV